MFAHFYLDVLTRGHSEPVGIKLVEELTASLGAGLCLLVPIWAVRRARAARWSRPRTIALYALLLPVFSLLHTSWNWASRNAVFPLFHLGPYDYGRMPLRYAMEFPTDVVVYSFVMSLLYLFHRYREARDRELRLAQVEVELARVRLETLEGQLRPHFLFNVLNTVSSVMYDDVAAADTMLTQLAELLRRALRGPAATVPLADELETLDLYLAVMRARFAERLHVEVHADAEAREARVPPLVLQPLVENAIIHGDPSPGAATRIAVRARRENGRLILEVEDNGPGITGPVAEAVGRGIGLSTTARRLTHLYGSSAGVTLANLPSGGARAVVTLPYTVAS